MTAIKLHASLADHPGPWLRDERVDPRGLSVTGPARARAHADRIKVREFEAA